MCTEEAPNNAANQTPPETQQQKSENSEKAQDNAANQTSKTEQQKSEKLIEMQLGSFIITIFEDANNKTRGRVTSGGSVIYEHSGDICKYIDYSLNEKKDCHNLNLNEIVVFVLYVCDFDNKSIKHCVIIKTIGPQCTSTAAKVFETFGKQPL
jgi:hypothetical protein